MWKECFHFTGIILSHKAVHATGLNAAGWGGTGKGRGQPELILANTGSPGRGGTRLQRRSAEVSDFGKADESSVGGTA